MIRPANLAPEAKIGMERRTEFIPFYGQNRINSVLLRRRGLTLLEIIVSMTIFLMALGGVIPLIQMGQERALEVQLQTLAIQRCQAKMADVIAGIEALSSQSDVQFADSTADEDWRWSMIADGTDIANLWSVKVTVYRMLDSHKLETSITQLVMDPAIRGGPTIIIGGGLPASGGQRQ